MAIIGVMGIGTTNWRELAEPTKTNSERLTPPLTSECRVAR